METKKVVSSIALFALLFVLFSVVVSAEDTGVSLNQQSSTPSSSSSVQSVVTSVSSGNGLTRIAQYFKNEEWKNNSKLFDFMLYFLLFFSLCWLGFGSWFGGGNNNALSAQNKGAVIGLSTSIALALAFALHAKFPIAHLFPMGKFFLFVTFTLLMYGLLSNPKLIGSNTFAQKALSIFVAIVIVYLSAAFLSFWVCKMEKPENDKCSAGPLNSFYSFIGSATGLPMDKAPFYNPYVETDLSSTSVTPIGGGSGSLITGCEGGLRLDVSFEEDLDRVNTKGRIQEFISKAGPGSNIQVYGFSQDYDDATRRQGSAELAYSRASKVESIMKSEIAARQAVFKPLPTIAAQALGTTNRFSLFATENNIKSNAQADNRVVISTAPISSFTPAPPLDKISNCGGVVTPGLKQCSDGLDNDEDGLIDMQDKGCQSADDNDEQDGAPCPTCCKDKVCPPLTGSCEEQVNALRPSQKFINFNRDLARFSEQFNDLRDMWGKAVQKCSAENKLESKIGQQALGHYYYYSALWNYQKGTLEDEKLALEDFKKAVKNDFDLIQDANSQMAQLIDQIAKDSNDAFSKSSFDQIRDLTNKYNQESDPLQQAELLRQIHDIYQQQGNIRP